MRRSLLSVVPVTAVLAVGLAGLTATTATASPAPAPAKGTPAAVATAPAPSSKVPAVPAASFQGYQTVNSATLTDPAGTQVAGTVACPRGTKVVGGGAVITSTGLAENLNGSFPLSDGRTWRVYVNNTSSTDGTFTVYATCVKRVVSYSIATGGNVDNPAGSQNVATVACPSGTVPLGGGGYGTSQSNAVNLNSSLPITGGWRVDVNNASTDGDIAIAFAVCGASPTSYKVVAGASVANPASTQTGASAACPAGRAVLSGGAFSGSGSTSVNLNSSVPFGSTAWQVYENNSSAGDTTVRPYAVCAKANA